MDLSTDEIVALAREANIQNPVALDNPLIGKIGEKYTNLNSFQKNIIQIVSRGFLNILLRTYSNPSFEKNIQEQVPVYDIILGKRNALIAEAIIESPVPNIYIHYGALHYAGILAMLREKDPKWREISRTEYQVIQ